MIFVFDRFCSLEKKRRRWRIEIVEVRQMVERIHGTDEFDFRSVTELHGKNEHVFVYSTAGRRRQILSVSVDDSDDADGLEMCLLLCFFSFFFAALLFYGICLFVRFFKLTFCADSFFVHVHRLIN